MNLVLISFYNRMSGLENLSERDRAVLRSIFDPTATIGDVADDGDSFEEDEGELNVIIKSIAS